LARLAKEAHPVIQIVFGGANWHGAPGPALHGHLPFVDFAISGEADHSFPQLVRHLAGDPTVELGGIPGLIRRTGPTTCVAAEEEPVPDLDALPVPDFSDFYEARHSNPGVRATLPSLTVETSRGCWWATTGPCTFCGMDRRERVYRAKSPRRILEELRTLAALWPCSSIHLADTVVSEGFLDDVLPALAIEPRARRLFFEVRPTLSKAQVDSIAAARAEIQPGIESFSGHVLRLMHKGTGVLENIRLLKWCRAAGVDVSWNLLHGLPGETQEDYEAMFAILPSIRFLAPPQSTQPVTVDRYSPYFEAPESYGIAELRPLDPYRYLYPFPARDLADIAYSFGFACAPGQALPDVGAALETEAGLWRRESSKGCLRVLEDTGDCITLSDRRACATAPIVELDGLESILYAACDDIASRLELAPHIHRRSGGRVDQATIDAALESLVARRLMVAVGERYLSLALPATS